MKLYEVCNGYMGEGPVHVLVICYAKDEALALASQKFKSEQRYYPDDYWQINSDWTCELIADLGIRKVWCSEVRE